MNLKVCTWLWCCLKIMAIVFQHWKIFRVINLLVIHVACFFFCDCGECIFMQFLVCIFLLFCFVIYNVLIVVWMSDYWIYLQLLLINFIGFVFWIEAFHIPFSIYLKSCKLCLNVHCSFGVFFFFLHIYIYIYCVCVQKTKV